MKCDKCGRSMLSAGRPTPLGQSVCASCSDKVNGLIIGGATGGLGGAVAGPGIVRWIRTSMSGRPKQ